MSMKIGFHTSLAFLTSLFVAGCAHDEPGLRMLNDRAEYDLSGPEASLPNLDSSEVIKATVLT